MMNKNRAVRWAKTILYVVLAALVPILFYFFYAVGVPLALGYFAWLYFDWRRLKSCGVVKRDDQLIQLDRNGRETASIILSKPYTVNVSFKSFLKAIYTVRQGDSRLQFTSETKNARFIAVDVLNVAKEWPPVGPWNFGW